MSKQIPKLNPSFYPNVEFYRRGQYGKMLFYDEGQSTYFKLHSKQIEALVYFNDDSVTYLGFGGGARGGKSAVICVACLLECFVYPGARYLIGRRDLQQVYGTTWKTMIGLFKNFGFIAGVHYVHNQQKNEVVFFNGSEIILKNLELLPRDHDATAFGSLEITKAFIDQSENVELKIISKIGERVGSHLNEKYNTKGKVLECFNPLKQSHITSRYWLPYRNDTESITKKFVRSLASDNPSPAAQRWVADRIKDYQDGTMSEAEYRKQVLGDFETVEDETALIQNGALEAAFTNKVEKGIRCMTIDIAGSGKDSLVIVAWDGRSILEMITDASKINTDIINRLVRVYKDKYNISVDNIVFDADGIGNALGGELAGARRFNNGSTNYRTKSGGFNNLKSYCAFKFAENLNKGLYSFKECGQHEERIRRELPFLMRKNKQNDVSKKAIVTKDIIKKKLGRSPDVLDAFIMREFLDDRATNIDHGLDNFAHIERKVIHDFEYLQDDIIHEDFSDPNIG